MNVTINAQPVDLETVPAGDALTPDELVALERLDTHLRADPEFQRRYPQAKLVRVDNMRALSDDDPARYYLRYSSAAGTTEFWGHVGAHDGINLHRGFVAVTLEPSVQPARDPNAPVSDAVAPRD